MLEELAVTLNANDLERLQIPEIAQIIESGKKADVVFTDVHRQMGVID